MCGIAGIYYLQDKRAELDRLKSMTEEMIFRGPDDEGYFLDGSFGFGMRRLSIIDVEHGKQPVFDEEKRYAVILNGEIYNHVELRQDLIKRGHRFSTQSDTEVLVHLFEEKREKCVDDLNGMFSFCVWDRKERELFLFRDRLGIKPLFYSFDGSAFYFASALKALVKAKKNAEVDLDSFWLYLGLSYVPYPKSILKNIHKLEPAHFLKLDSSGRLIKKRYWSPDASNPVQMNADEYTERIRSELARSVSLQLRSDVPVGVFLSGGLDSSSIVAFMRKFVDKPIETFSVAFEDGFNELPFARQVAKQFGVRYNGVVLNSRDIPALLSRAVHFLDEPLSDNSIIPTFLVSQEAHKAGIKVILSGSGGDELFGGYTRHTIKGYLKLLLALPQALRNAASLPFFGTSNFNPAMKIRHPELMFLDSGLNLAFYRSVLNKPRQYQAILDLTLNHISQTIGQIREIEDVLSYDLQSYLVDDVLALMDKMTMANSVEGRVPFLDHTLVEFALQIPVSMKIREGQTKWLLRKSMEDILPPNVTHLPKKGFSGPTAHWVNGPLKSDIRFHLTEQPIDFLQQYFDIGRLRQMLNSNNVDPHFVEPLFGMYVFTLWYKKHLLNQDFSLEMVDNATKQKQVVRSLVSRR